MDFYIVSDIVAFFQMPFRCNVNIVTHETITKKNIGDDAFGFNE